MIKLIYHHFFTGEDILISRFPEGFNSLCFWMISLTTFSIPLFFNELTLKIVGLLSGLASRIFVLWKGKSSAPPYIHFKAPSSVRDYFTNLQNIACILVDHTNLAIFPLLPDYMKNNSNGISHSQNRV